MTQHPHSQKLLRCCECAMLRWRSFWRSSRQFVSIHSSIQPAFNHSLVPPVRSLRCQISLQWSNHVCTAAFDCRETHFQVLIRVWPYMTSQTYPALVIQSTPKIADLSRLDGKTYTCMFGGKRSPWILRLVAQNIRWI